MLDDLDFDPEAVECEHKYEHCINALCGTICHGSPSEHGCEFNYCCDHDNYLCDGKCDKHKKEGEIQQKKQMLHSLYDAQSNIDSAIRQLKEELECNN